MRGKRSKKSADCKVNLTEEDKRKLASLVEMHPEVWNLAHPRHRRPDTHSGAWEIISKEMNHPVDACKKAWKSLRDGLRYRKTPKKSKGKSGDSGPDDFEVENGEEQDEEITTWPFWECMKFVATQKSNRRTTSTMEIEECLKESEDNPPDATMPHSSSTLDSSANDIETAMDLTPKKLPQDRTEDNKSNYNYRMVRKRARPEDPADKLASGIADLIKVRKESAVIKPETLQYHSMFANLDRMFKQLPSVVVEDLNMQFTNITYEAIKRQQI